MAGKKSILVVDDQAGIRALLTEALGQMGYSVQAVSSGKMALECLDCNPVHLVILDVNLPGVSGLETLRELRRFHPQLPVLMITADEKCVGAGRLEELGVFGWISKPFDLNDLYQQVQAAIN